MHSTFSNVDGTSTPQPEVEQQVLVQLTQKREVVGGSDVSDAPLYCHQNATVKQVPVDTLQQVAERGDGVLAQKCVLVDAARNEHVAKQSEECSYVVSTQSCFYKNIATRYLHFYNYHDFNHHSFNFQTQKITSNLSARNDVPIVGNTIH